MKHVQTRTKLAKLSPGSPVSSFRMHQWETDETAVAWDVQGAGSFRLEPSNRIFCSRCSRHQKSAMELS